MPRFETVEDAQQLQHDMLRLLDTSSIDRREYATLGRCGPDHCALAKCSEACWFGTRRRRLRELPAAYRLISQTDGPVLEVQAVRACWGRPIGKLDQVGIGVIRQWNRRVLGNLYMPGLVAVGQVKVGLPSENETQYWIAGIHEIVAGAEKQDLEQAIPRERWNRRLADLRTSNEYLGTERDEAEYREVQETFQYRSMIQIKKVAQLGETVNRVLKRELVCWEDPARDLVSWEEPAHTTPSSSVSKRVYRQEYYRWTLGLPLNTRMIRYGLDRYFNQLEKEARRIRARKKRHYRNGKKHPYPYWLEPYMFGNHPSWCMCPACTGLPKI